MRKPEHILLQGVVGSTAYGMAHAGSDVDRGGVYAADPLYLLRLNSGKPEEDTYVQKAPQDDMWLHEAKKYLRLQLNGNPTATEILWLDDYEVKTDWGQSLIDIRDTFLSAKRVRYGYLGFATSQLHRFFGYDRETEDGRKHAAKNARHLYRLLWQGLRAYEGGGIIVRLPKPVAERARDFGERAAGGDSDLVHTVLKETELEFDGIRSPLPEIPNDTSARAWLTALRRSMFRAG